MYYLLYDENKWLQWRVYFQILFNEVNCLSSIMILIVVGDIYFSRVEWTVALYFYYWNCCSLDKLDQWNLIFGLQALIDCFQNDLWVDFSGVFWDDEEIGIRVRETEPRCNWAIDLNIHIILTLDFINDKPEKLI